MSPDNFFDEVAAHSKAKHDILHQYLAAWYPIMLNFAKTSGSNVLRYIDGFAGEGKFQNGEYDGSPLIALKIVLESEYLRKQGTIFDFLFFEETTKGHERLIQTLSTVSRPENVHVNLDCGEFETELNNWLDSPANTLNKLDPTFIFVDPFGPSGFSMSLMQRILAYRSTEVMITLNLQSIIRWCLEDSSKHAVLDRLFGCNNWRDYPVSGESSLKEDFLRNLYIKQLKGQSNILIRDFRMENKKGLTSYYLIYATHNSKGLEVMKNAMWKVDRSGAFQYSDITNPDQPFLFVFDEIAGQEFAQELLAKFKGRVISKNYLENYTKEHPHFLNKHLTAALNWLVFEAETKVISDRKRRGTGWSSETTFKFP